MPSGRTLLCAVEDSPSARLAFRWLLESGELTDDCSLHLLCVAMKDAAGGALPGGDYFEQAHPQAAQQVVQQMLQATFLAPLAAACPDLQQQPVLHIVRASLDAKTVGRIICEKAEALQADAVIIGASHRSRIAELLTGCVATYCKQHCSRPLQVVVQDSQGGGVGPAQLQQQAGA